MTTDDRRPTAGDGRPAIRDRNGSPAGDRLSVVADAPAPSRALTLVSSFGYAFQGLFYLFRTQRNAKIHGVAAVLIVALGLLLGIERAEWLAIAVMITLVLVTEGINTALEATVDLASPGYHELAKIAKDVAAGTVLLSAVGAVAVGALVFLPRLWALAISVAGGQ